MGFTESRRLVFPALVFLVLLGAHPSAATCSCSSGSSPSYNFLGDPSFDADMMSYEEFSRSSYLENEKVQVGAASTATALNDMAAGPAGVEGEGGEQNRINKSMNISLDLDDGSHIDFILRPAGKGKGLLGRGDLTRDGEVETERESVNATGTRDENRLFLELVSQAEATYRFDLQTSGEAVLGNYTRVMPDRETKQGTAIGVRRS